MCSVRTLRFHDCKITAEMLAWLAGSTKLHALHFARWNIPFTATDELFVEMAAMRSAPLTLSTTPMISPHIIALCRAAAERAHGAQYITFMDSS